MDRFRENFNKKVVELNSKKDASSSHLTSEKYKWIVDRLIELKGGDIKKVARDYRMLKTYEVVTQQGLTLATSKLYKPKTQLLYLCHGELFDAIREIHLATGHGARDIMHEKAKKKYANVTKEILQLFTDMCEDCQLKKQKMRKSLAARSMMSKILPNRCQIDLIDMRGTPDGKYCYILNYQDLVTEFIILRPVSSNSADVVANELVDIFCMFGPPHILQSSHGKEFIEEVVKEVTSAWPHVADFGKLAPGDGGANVKWNVKSAVDVESILSSWMTENVDKRWSDGIRFVQWQKNTGKNHSTRTSPFSAMFYDKPSLVIKSNTHGAAEESEKTEESSATSSVHLHSEALTDPHADGSVDWTPVKEQDLPKEEFVNSDESEGKKYAASDTESLVSATDTNPELYKDQIRDDDTRDKICADHVNNIYKAQTRKDDVQDDICHENVGEEDTPDDKCYDNTCKDDTHHETKKNQMHIDNPHHDVQKDILCKDDSHDDIHKIHIRIDDIHEEVHNDHRRNSHIRNSNIQHDHVCNNQIRSVNDLIGNDHVINDHAGKEYIVSDNVMNEKLSNTHTRDDHIRINDIHITMELQRRSKCAVCDFTYNGTHKCRVCKKLCHEKSPCSKSAVCFQCEIAHIKKRADADIQMNRRNMDSIMSQPYQDKPSVTSPPLKRSRPSELNPLATFYLNNKSQGRKFLNGGKSASGDEGTHWYKEVPTLTTMYPPNPGIGPPLIQNRSNWFVNGSPLVRHKGREPSRNDFDRYEPVNKRYMTSVHSTANAFVQEGSKYPYSWISRSTPTQTYCFTKSDEDRAFTACH